MMELNKFYNMDCMEYMKTVPDKFFELAIADPPYGIGQDGRSNHTRGKRAKAKSYKNRSRYDNESPGNEYFKELIRITKNQILFGSNHYISKIPYDSSCWIVWDKLNGKSHFADCELAWTSFKTAVRKFSFQWNGMLQGYGGNKNLNEKRIHPNQKPVALYRWLLQNYAKPGDKIFDSHVGSASSIIACLEEKFEYVGCELDKDYYRDACKRIEIHKEQLRLF